MHSYTSFGDVGWRCGFCVNGVEGIPRREFCVNGMEGTPRKGMGGIPLNDVERILLWGQNMDTQENEKELQRGIPRHVEN